MNNNPDCFKDGIFVDQRLGQIEMTFREMAIRKGAHEEYTSNSLTVLWKNAEEIEDFIDEKLKETNGKEKL